MTIKFVGEFLRVTVAVKMTIDTEEFISSFHCLTGTTIGERRRNLFRLLNEAKCSELDFYSLKPQTPLEEKFKVDALIYFNRTAELVEVLKSENPILIERTMKAGSWFLDRAFRDISGEYLVLSILPCISFNVKIKIINKLASHLVDTRKADEFFKAINAKYGLYMASKLLSACSEKVIVNCIQLNRIKPTPRQLLIIIRKHPHITEFILKLLKTNHINVEQEYRKVFMYIAKNDFALFSRLLTKYQLSLNLGRRATNRFICSNKQTVIKNPASYYELFHKKQISKTLKQRDFGDFFINLFPASLAKLDVWYQRIFSLITLEPQNLSLLFEAFKTTYGTELWDHPKYIYPKLLEMLPPNERENRLKIEYKPSDCTDDEWNCYWKIEKSIPFYKKRISLSSDYKARSKLVSYLVKTCTINKDNAALTGVCKYIVTHHRNDHIIVRLAFLTALQEKFKLENLEEQHWMYVQELIKVFTLNKETFYDDDEFLKAYIGYRLKNGLPIEEELTQWLQSHTYMNIFDKNSQYQKKCLLLFSEIIPKLYKLDQLQSRNLYFVSAIIRWNNNNPNDKISPFAFTSPIETLTKLLMEDEYVYSADSILVHCLRQKTDIKEKSDLLNLYLKPTNMYADIEVMDWLIRHQPLTVGHNIDAITQLVLNMEAKTDLFWKNCRNYSHLEIPQKIINNCLSLFKDNDLEGYKQELLKSNVIIAMSYLMTPSEFQTFIVPYYPVDLKVNVHNEDAKKVYLLQKTIGASIKNVIPTSQMFDSILAFCKGDYLKLICVSLYSASYKANENKLISLLSELSGRAVSVRKHELHLAFRALDKAQIFNVVNKFMETEKNASVRKFILKGIFNFFIKNPNDYSWELVKLNVNSVDINDKEAFGMLINLEKIPCQYLVQYIPFTWDILSRLPDPDGDVLSKKITVLNSIPSDVIQLLPKEFCDSIIQSYLFKEQESLSSFQMAVHSFTCNYIVSCGIALEKENRVNANFVCLKNYVNATWNNVETRNVGRKTVSHFVKEFCMKFLTNQYDDKEILKKFVDLWNNFLKPHDFFETYLCLQITLIYIEKLAVPEVVQKIQGLCDSLTSMYGSIVLGIISEEINWFLVYLCQGSGDDLEVNKYNLFENLAQSDSSIACLLLVILLLNNTCATIPETKVKYKKIIELLGNVTDPVIQLYLNKHFN